MNSVSDTWISRQDWWFPNDSNRKKIDNEVIDTFGSLLDEDHDASSRLSVLDKIILFDQIPRHYYRHELCHHIISYWLEKALHVYQEHCSLKTLESFTDIQLCFFLMPLRHRNKVDDFLFVIKCVWDKYIMPLSSTLKRFLSVTYEKAPLRDLSERFMCFYDGFHGLCKQEWQKMLLGDIIKILDHKKCTRESIESIESIQSIQSIQSVKSDKSVKTFDIFEKAEWKHSLIQIFRNSLNKTLFDLTEREHIFILSISGGVDSMVCAYIMKALKIKFCAVFINYHNRDESEVEEHFLRIWCHCMGIPLYTRKIKEINRKAAMENEMRKVYEDYTKKVRFDAYKFANNDFFARTRKSNSDNVLDKPYVILGHNQDDCFENILTNLSKGEKISCLKGMSVKSDIDGIVFLRPLLDVSKSEIYAFAKQCHIPFLKDSTVTWSQRGKIRDKIKPILDSFNKNLCNQILKISDDLTSYHYLIDDYVQVKFQELKENGYLDMGCLCMRSDTSFWKSFLTKVYPGKIPSNKSVKNFISCLDETDKNDRKIVIHPNLYVLRKSDKLVFF